MLSTTRRTPITRPAPGVIPGTTNGPVSLEPPAAVPNTARAREAPAAANRPETSAEHFRREVLRGRLHGSRVSLVWLVLAAAILGWGLGLIASARFHWRTRAPRRDGEARS